MIGHIMVFCQCPCICISVCAKPIPNSEMKSSANLRLIGKSYMSSETGEAERVRRGHKMLFKNVPETANESTDIISKAGKTMSHTDKGINIQKHNERW